MTEETKQLILDTVSPYIQQKVLVLKHVQNKILNIFVLLVVLSLYKDREAYLIICLKVFNLYFGACYFSSMRN